MNKESFFDFIFVCIFPLLRKYILIHTTLNFCDPVKRCLLMIKIYIHRKIVLPVCFGIIRMMIFYYQLQKFRISLCTNSVVIYREKKFSLPVFYPNYIQKQGKRFSLILFLNNIGFLLLSGEV